MNLSTKEKLTLVLTRVSLGWFFLYAGLTKVLDPAWIAVGYLKGARTFAGFYMWLADPSRIGTVDFMNKWGLTLLGVSLVLGIGVRLSSVLGAALMALYYLPILQFPHPNPHAYIVDEHVIYAFVLLFFAAVRAGRIWGLEAWCADLPICRRFPSLHRWFG